ncbi:MAG: WD40 repeat domain-containing protein, partial [Planctomycetaceae bacterium]|nr:WD40 repeat domain-containing protein [Planctomycetaceae bacterium]
VQTEFPGHRGTVTACLFDESTNRWYVGTNSGSILSLTPQLDEVSAEVSLSGTIRHLARPTSPSNVQSPQLLAVCGSEPLRVLNIGESGQLTTSDVTYDFAGRERSTSFQNAAVVGQRVLAFDSVGKLSVFDRHTRETMLSQVVAPVTDVLDVLRQRSDRRFPPLYDRTFSSLTALPNEGLLLFDDSGVGLVCDDTNVRFRDLWQTLTSQAGPRADLAEDPADPSTFWILNADGDLMAFDAEADTICCRIPSAHPGGHPTVLAVRENRLLTAGGDNTVRVWSTVRRSPEEFPAELQRFEFPRPLMSIAVSETAGLLAVSDVDAVVTVQDLATGRRKTQFAVGEGKPHTGRLSFNCDGSHLAVFGGGQSFAVFDTIHFEQVNLSGRSQLGGDGGIAMCWSPVSPQKLIVSESTTTGTVLLEGRVPAGAAARTAERISAYAGEPDFAVTHDGRRIVGLKRTGELYFLSPEHFIRTSSFPGGSGDSCALAVSANDRLVLTAGESGELMLGRFRSAGRPAPRADHHVPGGVHALILPEDRMQLVIECNPKLNSQGDGLILIGQQREQRQREGDLLTLRRQDGIWRLNRIVLPDSVPAGKIWFQGQDIRFDSRDRAVIAFRYLRPGTLAYDGSLALGYEQPDGSWTTEVVMDGGNAGHSPLMIPGVDGAVSRVLHYNWGGMFLTESSRQPDNPTQWNHRIISSTAGVHLNADIAGDGVVHAWMSSGRFAGDMGPKWYLQLPPVGPPVFETVGFGYVRTGPENRVYLIERGGEIRERRDDTWHPVTNIPGTETGVMSYSSVFIDATGTLWTALAGPKLQVWGFRNNTWTGWEIENARPPETHHRFSFWIQEDRRCVLLFHIRSDTAADTLTLIDAVLPKAENDD